MKGLRGIGMALMIVWMITGALRAIAALFAADFLFVLLGGAQVAVAVFLYDRLRQWQPASPEVDNT
jgi:membrane protein implicated in regulation of membrane protease activity